MSGTPAVTGASFIEEVQEDTKVQDAYMVYQLTLVARKDKKSSTSVPVSGSASTPTSSSEKKLPQYKLKIEDATIVQKGFDHMMESPVTLSQGELLALAPDIQKMLVDSCKVNRILVYSATSELVESTQSTTVLLNKAAPLYMAPIMGVDIKIQGKHSEAGSDAAVRFGLYTCLFKWFWLSPLSEKKVHKNQFRIG